MKRVIAVLFVLLLMLGCKKGESEEVKAQEQEQVEVAVEDSETYKRVTAEAGLKMRDKPGLDGTLITVIPYNNTVIFVEEVGEEVTISNRTGRWTKVQWKTMQEGWVFGGFLEDVEK